MYECFVVVVVLILLGRGRGALHSGTGLDQTLSIHLCRLAILEPDHLLLKQLWDAGALVCVCEGVISLDP